MEQRISLITLGVRDAAALSAFYDALGWVRVETQDGVIAYDLIGQTLALYQLEKLAEDIGVDINSLGHGAMTLSYNVRTKEEVSRLMNLAQTAGAKVLKAAGDVFWGGHIGYFSDPEGHIWEVAYNPFSPLGDAGEFRWNGFG
ncbi:VOC family protein [Sulfitobacter sp. F26204]|uniref:VOC family protein n=1 Tax=Sulfitobacter sp. F26204 TaxID=2996014 RepID=UPI00225DFAE7|nr:VOC family protein [Sulfitobacter sp. F26204]MCX7559179.1 VOC family protein [Sulfitobacter sp. F26204]